MDARALPPDVEPPASPAPPAAPGPPAHDPKRYLASPWFWLGILARVVVIAILAAAGHDLNDMNELLIRANQVLLAGESPYGREYTLTIVGHVGGATGTYQYPLSYPPVVLLVYLIPTALSPALWGAFQFNLPYFLLNAAFTFCAARRFVASEHRAETAIGWVYWCLPFWAYVEYVCFYPFLFLLLVLVAYHLDDTFRAPLYATLAACAYHILVFAFPVLICYQLRKVARLPADERAKPDGTKADGTKTNGTKADGGKADKTGPGQAGGFLPLAILAGAARRLRADWTPLKQWLVAIAPGALVVAAFLAWDFDGVWWSLVGRQVERGIVGTFQVVVVAVALAGALALLCLRDPARLRLYAIIALVVTFLLEGAALVYYDYYHLAHYYALFVPFLFPLVKTLIYDAGWYDRLAARG